MGGSGGGGEGGGELPWGGRGVRGEPSDFLTVVPRISGEPVNLPLVVSFTPQSTTE
jgi:hypothetical protein